MHACQFVVTNAEGEDFVDDLNVESVEQILEMFNAEQHPKGFSVRVTCMDLDFGASRSF